MTHRPRKKPLQKTGTEWNKNAKPVRKTRTTRQPRKTHGTSRAEKSEGTKDLCFLLLTLFSRRWRLLSPVGGLLVGAAGCRVVVVFMQPAVRRAIPIIQRPFGNLPPEPTNPIPNL